MRGLVTRLQVAIWNWQQVYERTVYSDIHQALTNTLRFLRGGDGMLCCSASSDGLLKVETYAEACCMPCSLSPAGTVDRHPWQSRPVRRCCKVWLHLALAARGASRHARASTDGRQSPLGGVR